MNRKPHLVILHTLLSLMVCLGLACTTAGQESGGACPAIEVREMAEAHADSTRSVTDTTTILTSRASLVATGDITGAAVSRTGDEWVLHFIVSDDAAKRIHEFSKENVGKRLALVVDGKVHGTPRIAGAITGNGYQVDGLDRPDAERIATAISNGCRP